MPVITLKVSKLLKEVIAVAAKKRALTQSELVRRAIESYLREQPEQPTPYDLVRDLIENLPHQPRSPRLDPAKKEDWGGFGLTGPEYRAWLKKRRQRDRRHR